MPLKETDQFGLVQKFEVKILESKVDLGSWTKVEGLDVTWDVCEYRSGDDPNFRWYFPGMTKYTNIKLTRAAVKEGTAAVKKWLDDTSHKWKPCDAKVTLKDSQGDEVASWDLKRVMPVKWSITGFDASASKVAVETLELAHEGFLDDEKK
jgi:phage tail-like protein